VRPLQALNQRGDHTLAGAGQPDDEPRTKRRLSGWRELGFLTLLYVAYAASRVFADDSMAPARERAMPISIAKSGANQEDTVRLDVERDVVA